MCDPDSSPPSAVQVVGYASTVLILTCPKCANLWDATLPGVCLRVKGHRVILTEDYDPWVRALTCPRCGSEEVLQYDVD